MTNDILIISATKMEISPLLDISVTQPETLSESGRTIIQANYKNHNFRVLITGPGVINSAQALTIALEKCKPRIVIQTGIAGIFKETGLQIGDIALAESERYLHTGIEKTLSYPYDTDPLPFDLIPGNSATRKGLFPVHSGLTLLSSKIIRNCFNSKETQILRGPFITISTITASPRTAEKIFTIFSPCMENMEGSATAHVAALYKIPFIEIRSGSNYVGERNKSKWDIPLASERASLAIASLIEHSETMLNI